MALKTKTVEVRHVIASGPLEELNVSIAVVLNDGWDLKETRMLNADYHNQIYTIFYIFVRAVE